MWPWPWQIDPDLDKWPWPVTDKVSFYTKCSWEKKGHPGFLMTLLVVKVTWSKHECLRWQQLQWWLPQWLLCVCHGITKYMHKHEILRHLWSRNYSMILFMSYMLNGFMDFKWFSLFFVDLPDHDVMVLLWQKVSKRKQLSRQP